MRKKKLKDIPLSALRKKIKILADESYKVLNHLSLKYEEDMVRVLVQIVEERDAYTRGHSEKVTEYAVMIAERLGLPEEKIDELKQACLLHDLGKIAIDRHILNKKGPLTKEEWDEIKKHPQVGARIARQCHAFKSLVSAIRHHHEKYSGGGYPNPKMKRRHIPLYSRIIAIADAWDAMLSDRAYRKALTRQDAVDEIKRCRGTQFDPKIADLFLDIIYSCKLHPERHLKR